MFYQAQMSQQMMQTQSAGIMGYKNQLQYIIQMLSTLHSGEPQYMKTLTEAQMNLNNLDINGCAVLIQTIIDEQSQVPHMKQKHEEIVNQAKQLSMNYLPTPYMAGMPGSQPTGLV